MKSIEQQYPTQAFIKTRSWRLLILSLLTTLGVLTGCATSTPEQQGIDDMSAAQLSNKGNLSLQQGNYLNAVDYYAELVERFPTDHITEGGRLQLAYALYKHRQPQKAIDVAEEFIRLYPEHKNLAYAMYLRGLAGYAISRDDLRNYMSQSPSTTALDSSRQAFEYFSELASRFPKSRYFNDSMQRIVKLRDGMAAYDVYVANYYFKQGDFKRAQARAEYVTRYFPRSPAVADALAVVAKSQLESGLKRKAKETLAVIESNYPNELVTEETREYFNARRKAQEKK